MKPRPKFRVAGRAWPAGVTLAVLLNVLPACSSGASTVIVANAFNAGAGLPAYVNTIPRGSRGDVVAKGHHDGSGWTVEICRRLDTGHPDDAIFRVGEDRVFSLGITDNSGGTHNGRNVVHLVWNGLPTFDIVVVADLSRLGQSAPVIDGVASDGAWAAAPASTIAMSPQSGDNGITRATVQAAYLDDYIYFRVSWLDATRNDRRHRWSFDGANWTQSSANEDRLYFMFDISNAQGTFLSGAMQGTTEPFARMGCAIACHGDGVMRMDSGRADIWHWKASRTDPAGFLDDKWIAEAAPGQNGRHSDEGTAAYVDNKNAGGTGPAYRSAQGYDADPDFLFMLPEDHDFATARAPGDVFTSGDFLPGYVQRIPLDSRADVWANGAYDNGTWTVEFSRRLDTGHTYTYGSPVRFDPGAAWKTGDTLPGYVSFPPKGSFGDVRAMGRWVEGEWTVEICRLLDTGHPDDAQFDPAGDTRVMSIGVTDNSGGTHNGRPVVNLEWSGAASYDTVVADPLGATPEPVIDGTGQDPAWTTVAQTSRIPLTIQSGSGNGIREMFVQAVRTDTKIYFKFRWVDPTHHEFREQWSYVNGNWSQSTANEDRLYVMFDLDGATGTSTPGADDGVGTTPFTGVGCAMACHGDGVMRTNANRIDTWHWKATRNNGSGWLDDKHMVPAGTGVNGRKSDDGTGIAVRNRNAARTQPNYQAFDDPGERPLHLHFDLRPDPDDAAFIVGRDIPFALGLTDNSGGTHDGAPLLTLGWSGASTSDRLSVLDLDGSGAPAPDIDGRASDGAWNLASPAIIATSPQSGAGFGITSAEMRAVHDRQRIYVLVRWDDPSATRDILKARRLFDGVTWSSAGARNEDRTYLLWGCFGEALGTATRGQADGTGTPFRDVGCAMACHGDGVMRTDSGRLDMWHWKAARTNGLGFSDDKYFGPAGSGSSGRFGDGGRSSHSDNGTGSSPAFRAVGGPGANFSYLVGQLTSGAHRALSLVPPVNVAPQANAGSDQTVGASVPVTLNGLASFDPNGDAITYQWVQTSGNPVTLTGATTASPTFTSPAADTDLVFQLTVSDGILQDTDSVTVHVQATPPAVSFAADIHPLFSSLGCIGCHSGSSPAAGMDLSGSAAQTWPIVTSGRVDTSDPPSSLLLRKPLDPTAGGLSHGGGTFFASTTDPTYVLILNWITQGALNN